jgi:3-dehydroquinate synthase
MTSIHSFYSFSLELLFCVYLQSEIICKDEKDDLDIRALLNLGHTFGHVIELLLGYGTWLHGEAVSVGIAMALDLSLRQGWVECGLVKRVIALLSQANLPVSLPPHSIKVTPSEFKQLMLSDKKTIMGSLKLVLPRGDLGKCECTTSYDPSKLDDTLNKFLGYAHT